MGVVTINSEYVMHKSKQGSGGRLNPRRIWRSRSKARVPSGTFTIWTPQGNCKWISCGGRQVTLSDVSLLAMTEVENVLLRKFAIERLKSLDIGCSIQVPKSSGEGADSESKPKRRALMLRKRAVTTGSFESGKDSSESSNNRGLVFGVPLAKCIARDKEIHNNQESSVPLRDLENLVRLRLASGSQSAEDITEDKTLLKSRSLTGSQTSCNIPLDIHGSERFLAKDVGSFESLNLDRKSCSMVGLSLLDTHQSDWVPLEVPVHQIPHVVYTCFKHLEMHGLQQLGIFRVSSSKKRVRQLREDFDSGQDIKLGEEHCPHDVATLLKEYFRDLPEPLLTRDLYLPFVATQRIRNRRQQLEAMRSLVQLLPVPNRDTLWALLRFLARVASFSCDFRSVTGEMVTGNKMDSNNLATLFGPNILHTAKSGFTPERSFQVESAKRAEERIDVIKVVRSMVDNYQELFEVPATHLDEMYRKMLDANPAALSQLLQSRLIPLEIDIDPDTTSSLHEGSDSASLTHLPLDVTVEVITVDTNSGGGGGRGSVPESLTSGGRSSSQESLTKIESFASRLFRRRDKSTTRNTAEDNGEHKKSKHNKHDNKGGGSRSGSRSGSPEDGAPTTKSSEATTSRWFRRRGVEKSTSADIIRSAAARPLCLVGETSSSGRGSTSSTGSASGPQVAVVDIRKEHVGGSSSSGRRLSSPGTGDTLSPTVISASLTLKVPLSRSQTGPALAFGLGRDSDIPFIEDAQTDSPSDGPKVPGQPVIKPTTEESYHQQQQRSYGERRHRSTFEAPDPSEPKKMERTRGSTESRKSISGSERSHAAAAGPVSRVILRRSRDSGTGSGSGSSTSAPDSPVSPTATATSTTSSVSTATTVKSRDTAIRRRDNVQITKDKDNSSTTTSTGISRRSSGSNFMYSGHGDTWKRWEIIASEHTEQETVV